MPEKIILDILIDEISNLTGVDENVNPELNPKTKRNIIVTTLVCDVNRKYK